MEDVQRLAARLVVQFDNAARRHESLGHDSAILRSRLIRKGFALASNREFGRQALETVWQAAYAHPFKSWRRQDAVPADWFASHLVVCRGEWLALAGDEQPYGWLAQIYCGDLARYAKDLEMARNWYLRAAIGAPHEGLPLNQLAILEQSAHRPVTAVRLFLLAASAEEGFSGALANAVQCLKAAKSKEKNGNKEFLDMLNLLLVTFNRREWTTVSTVWLKRATGPDDLLETLNDLDVLITTDPYVGAGRERDRADARRELLLLLCCVWKRILELEDLDEKILFPTLESLTRTLRLLHSAQQQRKAKLENGEDDENDETANVLPKAVLDGYWALAAGVVKLANRLKIKVAENEDVSFDDRLLHIMKPVEFQDETRAKLRATAELRKLATLEKESPITFSEAWRLTGQQDEQASTANGVTTPEGRTPEHGLQEKMAQRVAALTVNAKPPPVWAAADGGPPHYVVLSADVLLRRLGKLQTVWQRMHPQPVAVLPSDALSALDKIKRENVAARGAIRWVEQMQRDGRLKICPTVVELEAEEGRTRLLDTLLEDLAIDEKLTTRVVVLSIAQKAKGGGGGASDEAEKQQQLHVVQADSFCLAASTSLLSPSRSGETTDSG